MQQEDISHSELLYSEGKAVMEEATRRRYMWAYELGGSPDGVLWAEGTGGGESPWHRRADAGEPGEGGQGRPVV